jgi:hypothetical protein
MRVVVFGGRDFTNRSMAFKALDRIHKQYNITLVIDGEAPGADTLAHHWAVARGIENLRFPANWAKYGRSAGPIRNRQMIEEGVPDMGVAFPGGRGTENMKQQLKKAGIKILNVVPASALPIKK